MDEAQTQTMEELTKEKVKPLFFYVGGKSMLLSTTA